ncbi:hypothetical protein FTUN_1219 [Frigoriglobus tundricola]|uniref:Uncharacterized protein n=1 Tax=Frigoriglobus tundricola TaxID=2774151 RepID=A0A6M5YI06_9BACT|nr:hypothetical protein FTUN_1219 [Frigoriglobus tundricola]
MSDFHSPQRPGARVWGARRPVRAGSGRRACVRRRQIV